MSRITLILPAFALLAGAAGVAAQEPSAGPVNTGTATIAGQVLNVANGEPVEGAIVYLPDLKRGAITDESGGFVLERMPEGEFRWRIQRIGYATWEADSPVADGDWFRIGLLARPEVLAGITVTADALEARRARVSAGVRVLDRADIIRGAASNGAEVLESVAGLEVVRCGGMSVAGSGSGRAGRNPLSLQRVMGGGGAGGGGVNPESGGQYVAEQNPTNAVSGRPVQAPVFDEECVSLNGQMVSPVVYLDDEPASIGHLLTLSPDDLFAVEVYGRGEAVYVFTQRYIERLAREGRRPRPVARF